MGTRQSFISMSKRNYEKNVPHWNSGGLPRIKELAYLLVKLVCTLYTYIYVCSMKLLRVTLGMRGSRFTSARAWVVIDSIPCLGRRSPPEERMGRRPIHYKRRGGIKWGRISWIAFFFGKKIPGRSFALRLPAEKIKELFLQIFVSGKVFLWNFELYSIERDNRPLGL